MSKLLKSPAKYVQGQNVLAEFDKYLDGMGKKLLITGKGRCNVTNACDMEDFFKQVASGQPDAFLDPRFQAVLERYKQYCDAGHLLKGSVSADHTRSQLNWLNNKAGFITNGLWLEAEMAEYIPTGFQMRFCASPLIEKEQKPTMVVHGNDIAVSAKTSAGIIPFSP